jgi:hypothetical protein
MTATQRSSFIASFNISVSPQRLDIVFGDPNAKPHTTRRSLARVLCPKRRATCPKGRHRARMFGKDSPRPCDGPPRPGGGLPPSSSKNATAGARRLAPSATSGSWSVVTNTVPLDHGLPGRPGLSSSDAKPGSAASGAPDPHPSTRP